MTRANGRPRVTSSPDVVSLPLANWCELAQLAADRLFDEVDDMEAEWESIKSDVATCLRRRDVGAAELEEYLQQFATLVSTICHQAPRAPLPSGDPQRVVRIRTWRRLVGQPVTLQ